MNSHTKIKYNRQCGMTLLELMVAIAIGSILLAGLASTFISSSRAQRELTKSGNLIENGRYAIGVLQEDLRHSGFFGYYYDLGVSTGVLPDPCTTTMATIDSNMIQPLSGYNAANSSTRANISSTTCGSLMTNANLNPGSDVLSTMRADTEAVTTTTQYDVYLQANSYDKTVFAGTGSTPASYYLKYPTKTGNTTVAETRQMHVNTYFVAPCVIGNGTDGVCDGSENEQTPTLKRLELSTDGSATKITIKPLVEGVEYFKVLYGIDSSPSTTNDVTKEPGDGIPDSYVASPSTAEWPNVVSVKIYLLVRADKKTDDHTDTKTYSLAGSTFGPFNDQYKRHVFTTEVRLINISDRREIPE